MDAAEPSKVEGLLGILRPPFPAGAAHHLLLSFMVKHYKAIGALSFAAMALTVPQLAMADTTDIGTMFVNLQASISPMAKLAETFAWLGGIAFFISATMRLRQMEQERATGRSVMFQYLAAVGLWSLSVLVSTISSTLGTSSTLGGDTSPLASGLSTGSGTSAVAAAVLNFVQLVGLLAFIRGVFFLKAYGENKDGSMGKALTHLFGGAMAINISWTISILAATFGVTAINTLFGIS